jgi:hypothetical protein
MTNQTPEQAADRATAQILQENSRLKEEIDRLREASKTIIRCVTIREDDGLPLREPTVVEWFEAVDSLKKALAATELKK